MLKLQYRWTIIVFSKKMTSPQKVPLEAPIAVVTTRKENFQQRIYWIKLQRSVKNLKKNRKTFQKCFSTKTSTDTWYIDCGFRQSDENFSLKVKSCSESEKNRDFFSFENGFPINGSLGRLLLFFQPWKMFFAILPKISKNIQKSSIFAGFLS